MRKITLLLSLFLTTAVTAASQTVYTADTLRLKVNKILLKKDLRTLADELAQNRETDVDSLLLRLEVFGRAKQPERIRQTVAALAEAKDLPPVEGRKWILEIVRQEIGQDLPALRIYYDRLTEDDGYYSTNPFIQKWEAEGNKQEFEAWLTQKSAVGTSWFQINLERHLKNGDAQPILDELAARVRQNPGDKNAFYYYLAMLLHAQEYTRDKEDKPFEKETDWMWDVFPAHNAVEAYELGQAFQPTNPFLAIKYYAQSLASTVTPEDIRIFISKYEIMMASGVQPQINWEKRLRYETKEKLAAAYQRTGQAYLAQPLVEELIANKKDYDDNLQLAGMVQAGSGARTVESKVLQDEGARSNSRQYWDERIRYYKGRGEAAQVVQAFREALVKIPSIDKVRFIKWFDDFYYFSDDKQDEQAKLRLGEILLDEFNRAPVGSELACVIAMAISGDGFGLENVEEDIFIRRQNHFRPVFEKLEKWNGSLLRDILSNLKLPAAQKTFYLTELQKLALGGPKSRVMVLDDIYQYVQENSYRVSLMLEFLRRTPDNEKNKHYRASAIRSLFEAYTQTGQWQTAEKLMNDRQAEFLDYWGEWLERLAISAARQNAANDALRIWLKAVNFIGHSRGGLINLADTPAKPVIRAYYLQMKQREPDSTIPGTALEILR